MKKARTTWKERAHRHLDDYEIGRRKGKVNQAKLAKVCGVSRQTLWRSAEIRARLSKLNGDADGEKGSVKRPSLAAQGRELRARIVELEQANERYVRTFIGICSRLDERGIDPVELLGANCADLIAGRNEIPWT